MKRQRKIPSKIMHTPAPITRTQLTPMSEYRKTEGIEIISGKGKEPIPITRANTELRRAYPYIFDAVSYAFTHVPEKFSFGAVYARIDMPYNVFLEYCLDDCNEQRQYLKEELYKLLSGGQPAKYIKISQEKKVFAQPVIIAFYHIEPETGKKRIINNIGQDHVVSRVEIQVIREFLTFEHGYLNQPKAFYAKIRHAYNTIRNNVTPFIEKKQDYRSIITHVKSISDEPITTEKAARMASRVYAQIEIVKEMEQGEFHSVFLALEYILVNRKKNIKKQTYDFLDLCDKCAPKYTRKTGEKPYYNNKAKAYRFFCVLSEMINMLPPKVREITGIVGIIIDEVSLDNFTVEFFSR
jgi:hypothetical protein